MIRRTRVIILGKKTVRYDRGDATVYTVPTLLQCRDRRDADDLERMIRGAGYYPTFHWPSEMLEFVRGVKDEVRSTGIEDREYHFRVRPERRDGKVQVKVEVKKKEGGARFSLKGVWACPPFHRYLWDNVEGLYTSLLPSRP